MKLISFTRRVTLVITSGLSRANISVNPGERILIDDTTAQGLSGADSQFQSMSDFWPFYEQVVGKPTNWRNKRVLFYRPRGMGDQLIASCLSRFFTDMLGARCYQLADRINEPLWLGNPYIQGMPIAVPIGIDALVRFKGRPFFDYFFPIESVSEWDCEAEQSNVYDRLFALVGFYHVPDRFKTPVFAINQIDRDNYQNWIAQMSVELSKRAGRPIDLAGGYIFYQLRATNSGRTIPIAQQKIILGELNELGLPILCIDDMALEPAVSELISEFKNAFDLSRRLDDNVRLFGVLVSNARLTVSPDSLAVHFAAASQTPCLSVWGPFNPESRIKYYLNQIALAHPERCANAFCHNYMSTLPAHLCPEGANQKVCACYSGITAEEIREAVSSLLRLSVQRKESLLVA